MSECDPILEANGVVCEYCGACIDPDDAPTTRIPSTVLYRCDQCGRWTE